MTQNDNAPVEAMPPEKLVARYTEGGHEADTISPRQMFIFLGVLAVVIALAGLFVDQLVHAQTNRLVLEQAAVKAQPLVNQRALEHAVLTDTSQYTDDPTWYRVPIDVAKDALVANPARLKAGPAPADFVHPDDEPKQPAPGQGAPAK